MKIINYNLIDNEIDKYILINPIQQQFFSLPKEESQVFTSRSYNYSSAPMGYTNDPGNESENRDLELNTTDTHLNASFMPTDYIGMSIINLPYKIIENFADFRLFNPSDDTAKDLYSEVGNNLKTFTLGVQMLKIPKNIFNTILTDEIAIQNNGGEIKKNYGNYFINISPRYIESIVSNVEDKAHFPFEKLGDNFITIDGIVYPEKRRRNIYSINISDFIGIQWEFESNLKASGRLIGSVVEIWDSSGIEIKQTKIMAENEYNLEDGVFRFVLSPDNMGYDSEKNDININDIVRVYPRESYFNPILIDINYEDNSANIKAALQYMVNDVTRDLTTGIYEIYDETGVKVDSSGNFDGKVIQKYQVQQFGKYEVRKKLKN